MQMWSETWRICRIVESSETINRQRNYESFTMPELNEKIDMSALARYYTKYLRSIQICRNIY